MVLWISGSRVDYSINDAGIIDSPYGDKHKILLPPPKKIEMDYIINMENEIIKYSEVNMVKCLHYIWARKNILNKVQIAQSIKED